uniref:NADH dehydrogenase subunit 2 n=1 Tax=Amphimerus sp. JM-2019 TaxID=2588351 RepID=A0A4Y5SFV0_9TREM|nr:NADH dehydrogenase subunit 2 [Amphimerus sp. JM-2019]
MRGVFLSIFSVMCMLVFSTVMFSGGNLLMFWLFLELSTLSLIPSFFLYLDSGVLPSLFSYIMVSGVSSSLIVSGVLFENFLILSVMGLLLKFGLFPLLGWVYVVTVYSNWLVVWGLSTVLKSAFLFFGFFLSGGFGLWLVGCCCFFTFIFVGVFLWLYTYGWVYFWTHVMVCSSAALIVMSVEVSSDLLLYVYLIYVVWSTLVILFLSRLDGMVVSGGGYYFLVVFLLVSFPGSLVVFYKVFIGLCVYSCGLVAFSGWVFYNVSEQFFLVKCLIGCGLPRSEWGGCISI